MRMNRCNNNNYRYLNSLSITVWVDVVKSLFKSSVEELATSWLFVMTTGSIPIWKSGWVNEIVFNKVVDCAFEDTVSSEINNTVSNEYSSHFNFHVGWGGRVQIVMVNSIG